MKTTCVVAPLAVPTGYKEIVKTFGKPDLPGKDGNVPLGKAIVPDCFRRLPYLAKGVLTCHKLLVSRISWIFSELERRGLSDKIKSFDGCYCPRVKRGGTDPSAHAWGIALDINAGENMPGMPNKIPAGVIAVFAEAGFIQLQGDCMHFQYCTGY